MINTVTGEVKSNQLGCTLVHEHLLLRSEMVAYQFPHLYDEKNIYQKALESVIEAKSRGVNTICDPTVMGIGRDVRFNQRISMETGVQIVSATGIYSFNEIPTYFQNRSINDMANIFVRDIEVGIQNTNIKAGFLKCTADEKGITPDLEKVFRAIGRAQKRTGVPIMTHSHPETRNGLKQLDILEDEEVNPKAIMIGHTGDTDNLEYIHQLLDRGVYIGMDRYGHPPLEYNKRNKTVIELIKSGFSNRIFLSQDYCCTIDSFPESHSFWKENPSRSMTFLLDDVIPELLSKGIDKEEIRKVMHDNVQRWFECR